jgi:hypothetical protein
MPFGNNYGSQEGSKDGVVRNAVEGVVDVSHEDDVAGTFYKGNELVMGRFFSNYSLTSS